MPKRRIVGATIVVVVVLFAVITWIWWLPGMVRSRAEAGFSERLGVRATVGDATLGLTTVTLSSVELHGQRGGFAVAVRDVEIGAGPFGLALRGTAAIERVAFRGVNARVDVDHDGLEGSLAAMHRARRARNSGAGEGETMAAGGRHMTAEDVAFVVADAGGVLVEIEGGEILVEPEALRATATRVSVGDDTVDHAVLHDLVAVLAPEGGRPTLSELRIGGGEIIIARRGAVAATPATSASGDEDDAPPSGAEEAAAVERHSTGDDPLPGPDTVASDEAEPRAGGPTADPGPDPEADDIGQPASLLGRLLDAKAVLSSALRGNAPGRPSDTASAPVADTFFDALAADAKISLGDVAVRARGEDGVEDVVTGLTAIVERVAPERFRVEGDGETGSGGHLGFRMQLEPAALRGHGTLRFNDLPLAFVVPFLPGIPWHQPERARLSGEVVVRAVDEDRLALRGRVALTGGAIYSPKIAPVPVDDIALSVEGSGAWLPGDRRLEIEAATVAMGDAAVEVAGNLEWARTHYLVELSASMPATPCNQAIGAIPRGLLGELQGFSWSGNLAGRMAVRIDSRALTDTTLDLSVTDRCEFDTVPAVADLRRFEGPFLHRVREPNGEWFEMTTGPGTGVWVPISRISPFLIHAVLAHEDGGFFAHRGFSVQSIRRALARNLEAGRYVVGASTITMQLAKNLFLHREKTLARKVQEVLLTWWLERALDKSAILELYLNVIEYGPGIYGLLNGSYHYFGRDPSELSPAESAFIASILPAPKTYHAHWERGALSERMAARIAGFLRHMAARGRIDEAALNHGIAEAASLHFHRDGAEAPAERDLPGSASPLPIAIQQPSLSLFEAWLGGDDGGDDGWQDESIGSPDDDDGSYADP